MEREVRRTGSILILAILVLVMIYGLTSAGVPATAVPIVIDDIEHPCAHGWTPGMNNEPHNMSDSHLNRPPRTEPVRILLLMDDGLGANYDMEDTFPCIRKQLEQYGWEIKSAALQRRVKRCEYSTGIGLRPVTVDYLIGEVGDVSEYGIVCLLPGNTGMSSLLASPAALEFVRTAAQNNVILAAWCKSVRVLAKAGLIDGLEVVGNADYKDEYEAAGATYLGNDHPPVTQGNIITSVRGRYYRTAMCEAMRAAVMAKDDRPSSPPDSQ